VFIYATNQNWALKCWSEQYNESFWLFMSLIFLLTQVATVLSLNYDSSFVSSHLQLLVIGNMIRFEAFFRFLSSLNRLLFKNLRLFKNGWFFQGSLNYWTFMLNKIYFWRIWTHWMVKLLTLLFWYFWTFAFLTILSLLRFNTTSLLLKLIYLVWWWNRS